MSTGAGSEPAGRRVGCDEMSRSTSSRHAHPAARVAVGLVATLGLAGLGIVPISAATPEPLPTDGQVIGRAWLDAPLRVDAAPGSTIDFGAVVVFSDETGGPGGLVGGATLRTRLFPATGNAPPSVGSARADWRGHFIGTLEVPPGGVGRLTLGQPGRFCNDSGCADLDMLFEPIEVGPPVGLPLSFLATARIVAPQFVTARQPALFEVDVQPRITWPAPGLAMPDRLILEVRVTRGPVVVELPIANSAADPGRYTGTLTLIEPGDYVVQLATTTDPSEAQLFGTALVPITVDPPAIPAPPATPDGLPDWWPLALAAAGLAVAALLIFRGRART
jgi:hypothetical protein